MITCTRKMEFDAAHRVLGHGGKCQFLHGHRYVVEVTVSASRLNPLGMVVDFSAIKETVGKWIDDYLDHNVLLMIGDPLQGAVEGKGNGRPPFLMDDNPTAENIAALLKEKAKEFLNGNGMEVEKVRVWETPNCWAEC